MENKENKLNFFSRVKIAVAKLENYSVFLEEKISVAIKYFFLIVLIFVVVLSAVETYSIMKIVNKGYQYIKNELPDFSYSEGTLTFPENMEAYDKELDFYMITDTSDSLSNEKEKEYINKIESSGIIFLKDKVIYKSGTDEITYSYSDLESQYGVNSLNKTALLEKIDSIGIIGIAVTIFMILLISLYVVQLISIFMDWLVISIFAFLVAKICRTNLTFRQTFNISIYALTLSIILYMLYNIAYYLLGFYTEYFRLVYLLIAYVYIVAVILMIKSDLLKQQIEIEKVIKVQKEVHDELNNPENKEEEDKKENKKTGKNEDDKDTGSDKNDIDGEPDGSEI